jgi:phosphotransferase system HPr (HPr) family protein
MPRNIHSSNTFTVTMDPALQLRPATLIARTVLPMKSAVVAEANGEWADCKSVLELCCLQAGRGTKIRFRAAGSDASRALDALQSLFATHLRCAESTVHAHADLGPRTMLS